MDYRYRAYNPKNKAERGKKPSKGQSQEDKYLTKYPRRILCLLLVVFAWFLTLFMGSTEGTRSEVRN